MRSDEEYELWKEQRAKIEVPNGFAERVMASVRQTRRNARWFLLRKLIAVAWQSRIIRTGIYGLALTVWILRAASLFLLFTPS